MTKVYDVFADEYIDREDMDLYAPPERYMEIDDNLLIKNAVRWLNEGLNDGLHQQLMEGGGNDKSRSD